MKRAISESDKEKRVSVITDAARKVFIRKGYEGATIREIALKAELTLATIYLYFKSKDELYGTIMEDVYIAYLALFTKASKMEGSTYGRLLSLVKMFLDYSLNDKAAGLIEIKISSLNLSVPLRRRLEKLTLAYYGKIMEIIEKGIEDGEIAPDTDALVVSYSVASALDGFLIMEACGDFSYHGYRLQEVAEKFMIYFCHGIFIK
jgi:AcrR family transcriptional regulator